MPSQYVELRWNSYHDRVSGKLPDYHVPKILGAVSDITSDDVVLRSECPCQGCNSGTGNGS